MQVFFWQFLIWEVYFLIFVLIWFIQISKQHISSLVSETRNPRTPILRSITSFLSTTVHGFGFLCNVMPLIALADPHHLITHSDQVLSLNAPAFCKVSQKQEKLDHRSVNARYLGLFSFLRNWVYARVFYHPVSRALLISTLIFKKARIYALSQRRKCKLFSDNLSCEKFTFSFLAFMTFARLQAHIRSLISEVCDSSLLWLPQACRWPLSIIL